MKKLQLLTLIILLTSWSGYSQNVEQLKPLTVTFKPLPEFNFKLSELTMHSNSVLENNYFIYYHNLKYHQPNYLSTNTVSLRYSVIDYNPVNLNPWDCYDSKEGLLVGGLNLLFQLIEK